MPPKRSVLDELGLLEDARPLPNPLEVLGIDRQFAGDLLKQDRTGSALQMVADGAYKVLSRLYHPDMGQAADSEKFIDIADAQVRLKQADSSHMNRWATRGSNMNERLDELRNERASILARAAVLHEAIESAAGSPFHFERFAGSRGLVAHDDETLFFVAPEGKDALTITRNSRIGSLTQPNRSGYLNEFRSGPSETDMIYGFLSGTEKVPLKPPYRYALYLDGEDGMFVYSNNPTKRPVNLSKQMLEARARALAMTAEERRVGGITLADWWLRSRERQFFTVEATKDKPAMQISSAGSFESSMSVDRRRSGLNLAWELGSRVVGGIDSTEFVKEALIENPSKNVKAIGVSEGAASSPLPVAISSLPSESLYAKDSGYTPELQRGTRLLLRDMQSKRLLVTDLQIIAFLP